MKGFVLAGTNSGCGKTTLSIGLMALLKSRGLRVAAFKTGPDFIDPAFHAKATGGLSYNLDTYLMSDDVTRHLFAQHTSDMDIAVVEGVMGLFDGMGTGSLGSTASLAAVLQLPVVLVVNGKGLHQSIAAMVRGYAGFAAGVRVAGVIINQVGDEQYRFLKQYVEDTTGVACLGYLPRAAGLTLESRHLGLVQADEDDLLMNKIHEIETLLAASIDIDALLTIADIEQPLPTAQRLLDDWNNDLAGLRLGVARDLAFQFYYTDNLELLQKQGAELVMFSPLNDKQLPAGIDAVYLGGGYPEVFARPLSDNASLRRAIKHAVENHLPVYAECGGLMYLSNGIITLDNTVFDMCGVFDCQVEMTTRLQRFGYCEVTWGEATTRAHEFHHSRVVQQGESPAYHLDFAVHKPFTTRQWGGGLRYKNALGGYPHVHFYSNPMFYKKIIDLWMQRTTRY